ncbi:bifunctional phosphoribosylaminoimidazolecarboxamide formyltransferase/IMP cyclohydrolase [Vampirovibrio chlorellavorus]|uniref:bifunctional phosphoribosylaminoimidazolecarboxamide formyltransferase/IMP cyclohydrolase n=1 Tax=Vampirovibrio chlorellavorus TaxID=758823 RepID=UPI0026EDD074|nr:bifunctional phosphoribosylaminoimidazolecarboxamide formyltransferase/IMP cyclohydrolase [Vampirovibrio chlorellavorus]
MKPELQPVFAGKKVAFISVFDKQGLEPLARALSERYGYVILSTGGTKKFLDERNIPAIESSEITGFGELLGGRVKSLHPEIFAGILAESKDRQDKDTVPFAVDVVVVNLYPFEAERDRFAQEEDSQDPLHMLHFVDIGGSALIRAAAKNYPLVNVLGSPAQYEGFLAEMEQGNGSTSLSFRKKLAVEAFAQSSYYDGLVQRYLMSQLSKPEAQTALPDALTLPLSKITDLRYGENPHQQAALYGLAKRHVDFEYLHGKELSYNNILDMQAAWNIATEFNENPACVIVKHNNPCGVAISTRSVQDAFQRALDTDPLSAFGGVVAFNQPVTEAAAKLMKDIFLEVIIAPDFEPGAFELLSTKKNLRLVKRDLPELKVGQTDYKQVADDLFLVQTVDEKKAKLGNMGFQIATEQKPTDAQLEDMVFAWKIVKHVKSNAIVLAKDGKTVGIGGGQTSRIGALESALKLACDQAKDAVLASDGFLPHEDNIYAAAQARVGAIIQPGGSVKDPEVIKLANQYHIAMVTTGVREFRH